MSRSAACRGLSLSVCALVLLASPFTAEARRHHRRAARTQVIQFAPFPSPVTGCRSNRQRVLDCEEEAAKAAGKLISRVLLCHAKQASRAFGDEEFASFDEEKCERKATRKFDDAIVEAVSEIGCSPKVVALAPQFRDLVVEKADARNVDLYCDGSSVDGALLGSVGGALIDPAGDDTGFVPPSAQSLGCSNEVGDELGDFARDIFRCHAKAADAYEDGESYDLDACRRHAREHYRAEIDETTAQFKCPSCLDVTGQLAVADTLLSFIDQNNQLIFPCPSTPSSTTTTTSTTTTQAPTTTTTTSTTGAPSTTTTTSTTGAPSTTTTTSTTGAPSTSTSTTTTHASTTTTTTAPPSTTSTTTTSTTTTTQGSVHAAFLDPSLLL